MASPNAKPVPGTGGLPPQQPQEETNPVPVGGLPSQITQEEVEQVQEPQFASAVELEELQRELEETDIAQATASTVDYYLENKDESYRIEPHHTIRGRAIVVTMTRNREGWKRDVRSLHHLFKSLNFSVQHVFDPDKKTLRAKLSEFAKDELNHDSDCSLVIFMGHGMGQGNNSYLQTKDYLFEIWRNCSQIFKTRDCKLHKKPKMFFAQVCRTETSPVASNIIKSAEPLNDYLLVFASQPGQKAYRNVAGVGEGSHFIQTVSDVLHQESHCLHVESILKKVQQLFERHYSTSSVQRQAPQLISTLPRDLNIFPGITTEKIARSNILLGETPEMTGTTVDGAGDSRKQNLVPSNSSNETKNNEPTQKPTKDGAGDSRKRNLLPSKSSNEMNNDEPKPKLIKSNTDENKPKARVTMTPNVTSNTGNTDCDCVENYMINFLKKNRECTSTYLSNELDMDISLEDVTDGSVTLHLGIEDLTKVDIIKDMCQTGVFANIMETYIITDSFLQQCSVHNICLGAVFNEESYKEIRTYLNNTECVPTPIEHRLEDIFTDLDDRVTISCATNDNAVQWYKDGNLLLEEPRIQILCAEGKTEVKICKLTVADSGHYSCTHTDPDQHQALVTTRCRLVVNGFSKPGVLEVKEVNSRAITLKWKSAFGEYTGYKIYYSPTDSNVQSEKSKMIDKETTYTLTGLLPWESYRLGVVTVHQGEESNETPTGGLTVTLHEDLLLQKHFLSMDMLSSDLDKAQAKRSESPRKPSIIYESDIQRPEKRLNATRKSGALLPLPWSIYKR